MKTAIIFGSSRGIGAEIALEFAKNNYFVVVNYLHSKDKAEQLINKIKSFGGDGIAIKADVSSSEEVDALVSQVINLRKNIDVAVINAGIWKGNLLIDTSIEEINSIISTNLLGTIYSARAVCKNMCENQSGKIITIASIWGEVGASCESVYSASKGGIIAFTKALAKELGYNNINVNCISPGLIDTEMNASFSKEDLNEFISNTPLSRIGTTQDIAKAALWLASDAASYINGQVISINGGYVV